MSKAIVIIMAIIVATTAILTTGCKSNRQWTEAPPMVCTHAYPDPSCR